ncbi:MAG: winged helix-turn-helix domain-containing protein [Marinospirillum sp.]|uniref:response regulator transcription factor n=1 Tax=Marinospirillum sp. TaxID=2183934 RepID=UPI0019F23082|nr:winged helix-turn-helix domain-containing protein [Marinospirillum sp.]MBE0505852.1 winged helix-turn-helix domain-containing protein [Marinospirillum sp.]
MQTQGQYRVLVAAENLVFLAQVVKAFQALAIYVDQTNCCKHLHSLVEAQRYDLLLLDRDLGDEDGLVTLRRLRQHRNLPVFILSSDLDQCDQLVALEMGADDCIQRNTDVTFLALRSQKYMERLATVKQGTSEKTEWNFSGWTLNTLSRLLLSSEGKELKLTRAEFDLLHALLHAKGQPLSRMQLADAVSKGSNQASVETIAVLVHRLRQKLGDKHIIQTFSGVGYRICAE